MLIQVLSNNLELIQPYLISTNTQLLLLQDGVYLLPSAMKAKAKNNSEISVAVLENDWLASGLAEQASFNQFLSHADVTLVNHDAWVSLCTKHSTIMTLQV